MASLEKFKTNPQLQLLEQIGDVRCVMLGSTDPADHKQPMSPQVDTNMDHAVYFYSDKFSELGKAVLTKAGEVEMVLIDKDYQAVVKGHLSVATDPKLVDKFWSPIVGAWYPDGQTDPKLMMLKFQPRDAAVWASHGNPIRFLFEVAKANLTGTQADMGDMKHVKM